MCFAVLSHMCDVWVWVIIVGGDPCVLLCCHTCVMYGYGSLLSVGIHVFGCVITDMCGVQALVIFYQ